MSHHQLGELLAAGAGPAAVTAEIAVALMSSQAHAQSEALQILNTATQALASDYASSQWNHRQRDMVELPLKAQPRLDRIPRFQEDHLR